MYAPTRKIKIKICNTFLFLWPKHNNIFLMKIGFIFFVYTYTHFKSYIKPGLTASRNL